MAKRGFTDGYATYDGPRGNPKEWKAAFAATMNLDEARAAVGDDSPEGILGIVKGCAWKAVVSAYRKMALVTHPDRAVLNGMTIERATALFKKVTGAFTILKERYGM